jgi:oligoendopeptidase F
MLMLRNGDEIHLVMNLQEGWIDLETLFHEMGHLLATDSHTLIYY